jgi:hypothetical protein
MLDIEGLGAERAEFEPPGDFVNRWSAIFNRHSDGIAGSNPARSANESSVFGFLRITGQKVRMWREFSHPGAPAVVVNDD